MSVGPPLCPPLQLAAAALDQLAPHVAPASAVATGLQAWARAALRLLQQAAAELVPPAEAPAQGVVGVAPPCHARFAELYCAWLALWVAARLPAKSWPEHSSLAAAVADLADTPVGSTAAAPTTPQLAAAAAAAVARWAGDAERQADSGSTLFLLCF